MRAARQGARSVSSTMVGVTGHQQRPGVDWKWTRSSIASILRKAAQPVRCLTSLAVGTDQIFAEEALRLNLELEAVLPFADYERCFAAEHVAAYRHLRDRSTRVTILRPQASDQASFLAAGIYIADACDLLIAVWDGEPAAALGGTADVVRHALETERQVIHLNPVSRTCQHLPG